MANPVEDFLRIKKAGLGFDAIRGVAGKAGPVAGKAMEVAGLGAALGAGGAAFAGVAAAAEKLYDAATKSRDFKAMMEGNPDLAVLQERDPAGFNALFSSLRKMAPEYTKEPLVAGTWMRKGMDREPETRGEVPLMAQQERVFPRPGPATEAALRAFQSGLGAGAPSFFKGPQPLQHGSTRSIYDVDPETGTSQHVRDEVTALHFD